MALSAKHLVGQCGSVHGHSARPYASERWLWLSMAVYFAVQQRSRLNHALGPLNCEQALELALVSRPLVLSRPIGTHDLHQ